MFAWLKSAFFYYFVSSHARHGRNGTAGRIAARPVVGGWGRNHVSATMGSSVSEDASVTLWKWRLAHSGWLYLKCISVILINWYFINMCFNVCERSFLVQSYKGFSLKYCHIIESLLLFRLICTETMKDKATNSRHYWQIVVLRWEILRCFGDIFAWKYGYVKPCRTTTC